MSNIQYYIPNVDEMVLEYLIYRGFTSTYKSLVSEKSKDRTKQFEVTRIVESIFMYLQNFEIESFISLWDFLSKRFFFHLDSEHLNLSSILKSDLLKFYLVNAIKQRSKDRITEFFSMYSHEILSESGDTIAGSLREWFVLPYLDEPEKDAAFTVYFSSKWSDALRLTLTNFLSIVLSSSPPPKLLLLERWFRAEAQQELRTQLKLSSLKVDTLLTKLESNGERVSKLINVIKDLVIHFQKSTIEGRRSSATSVNAGLFETDEVAEKNKIRVFILIIYIILL